VTVSVGVASLTPHLGDEAERLVEAADAGLYAAKRRGRNAVVGHGSVGTDHGTLRAKPGDSVSVRRLRKLVCAVDPSAAFVA